jgi:hypothetical protein
MTIYSFILFIRVLSAMALFVALAYTRFLGTRKESSETLVREICEST